MNFKNNFVLSTGVTCLLSASQLAASTVFLVNDDNGNGSTNTNTSEVNFTLDSSNSFSITTSIHLLNDGQSTFNRTATGALATDLNIAGVSGAQAVITLSNIVTSSGDNSLAEITFLGIGGNTVDNRDPANAGATWLLTDIAGGITSFDLTVDYLNPSGNPLGFAAAPDQSMVATPIGQVVLNNGVATTVDFSVLDSNGSVVNTDFTSGTGVSGGNTLATSTQSGGVATASLTAGEGINFQSFDDGDTIGTNDLFSSVRYSFTADSGNFDGSQFTISMDSAIVALDGVPEPTSAMLLSLGGVALILRRKRA